MTPVVNLTVFPRTRRTITRLDDQSPGAPAVLIRCSQSTEFGKQHLEEILGLPLKTIDAPWRGELAKELMSEPFGAFVIVESIPFRCVSAVFDHKFIKFAPRYTIIIFVLEPWSNLLLDQTPCLAGLVAFA